MSEIEKRMFLLFPPLAYRIRVIQSELELKGVRMVVHETFRSPERQRQLFLGGKATKADQWRSWHQYGLAADLVFDMDKKKKGVQDPYKGPFALFGKLVKSHGLTWGGDWGDMVHVQMDRGMKISEADMINQKNGILGVWQEICKRENPLYSFDSP